MNSTITKSKFLKMKKTLYLSACLLAAFSAKAQHHQNHDRCLTDHIYQQQIQNDPTVLERAAKLNAEVLQAIEKGTYAGKQGTKHIIPVVFHVFHIGGTENISKAQIESQIKVLNEDFNSVDFTNLRPEFWGRAANPEIEFRLASIDPQGNCTDGIVRIYNPITENASDYLKLTSVWPTDKYFNVWVVKDINREITTGTVLGYAQFPWSGSFLTQTTFATDGIVVRSDNIGDIGTAVNPLVGVPQKGRTTVHEIGHWLGLYHTFQDSCFGGDQVDDTPPVEAANSGCKNVPTHNTCTNDIGTELPDMVENFMDYSDGSCMSAFTIGQKIRMKTVLDNWRPKLTSESNLIATGVADPYTPGNCGPQAHFFALSTEVCEGGSILYKDDSYNYSGTPATVTFNWIFEGGTPANHTGITPPAVAYAQAGTYDVTLITSKTIGGETKTDTFTRNDYVRVHSGTAAYGAGYTQGFEWNTFPLDGWNIRSTSSSNYKLTPTGPGSIEGKQALYVQNSLLESGAKFYLESPSFDLSMINAPQLSFYHAFAQRRTASGNTTGDQMIVSYSTDCGKQWKNLYQKFGSQLSTTGGPAPITNFSFVPSSPGHWLANTVSLSTIPAASRNNVRFRFEFISNGGNNFYIDNINMGFAANTEEFYTNTGNFDVYPNPSTGLAKIKLNLIETGQVKVDVLDVYGRIVETLVDGQLESGEQELEFNIANRNLADGVYFVKMSTGGNSYTRRLMIIGQ